MRTALSLEYNKLGTFRLNTMAEQTELTVGSRAPDFALTGPNGPVMLSDFIGTHNLVIYFVREFACHTCMNHALTLAKMQDELSLTSTRTIMIGGGTSEAAQKTAQRYKLPFPVFGDPDRSIYHLFNLDKAMLLIQKSGTFLIDKGGIIRYANRASKPGDGLNKIQILHAAGKISQSQ